MAEERDEIDEIDALFKAMSRPSAANAADPLAGWDNVPLFMRSLPAEAGTQVEGQPPAEDNSVLDALSALMYDVPPAEAAAGFKAEANALFSQRKYREALVLYSKAIDECGKELEVEERRVLWSNRSAANLELGNYGAVLRDVALVLSAPLTCYPEPPSTSWNKTTLKALLRSARALIALTKLPEALDALQRLKLLETSMGNEAEDVGMKLRVEVESKIEQKEIREKESAERARRMKELEKRTGEALVARGVVLPKRLASKSLFHSCPTDITPPHFDPDSLPPNSLHTLPLVPKAGLTEPFVLWDPPPPSTPLIIPVFLLLPLANPPTRDLCLAFHTSSTFGEEIRAMDHDPAEYDVYIATKKGRVLKVGAKLDLGRVLEAAGKAEGDGWELKEGWALEMVGVRKGEKGAAWIADWKEKLKAGI